MILTLDLPVSSCFLLASASSFDAWRRLVTLEDYNTRLVLLGTMMLGAACGVIGCFLLLRKRALLSDALAHATLPGIAMAFMLGAYLGFKDKSLPLLLAGAVVTGVLGAGMVLLIRHTTRLKEDVALGAVLSVFFGAGIALLGLIQKMTSGHAAGLEAFIYGKTASMIASDAWLIAVIAGLVVLTCLLLYKELRLLCFDLAFAQSTGWPVLVLDALLMGLAVLVTVVGLQAVGLILIVAMLLIPPTAAQFWTRRLGTMMFISALIGGLSALVGAGLSAVLPRLPSGAMIVLTAAGIFILSMLLAPQRGLFARQIQHLRLTRKTAMHNLLRALYELHEQAVRQSSSPAAITARQALQRERLLARRSWSASELGRLLNRALLLGWVVLEQPNAYRLTQTGLSEAARITRNHRLWEMYLIRYADIAPSHVDRDADLIEHVLDPAIIRELEALVADQPPATVPASPHPITPAATSSASMTGRAKP